MAIPVLKLNLAPEPSLWRQNHEAFGWSAVGLGAVLLLATPTLAAQSCADQIAEVKTVADAEQDATRKEKALAIVKDAETDLTAGDEAFCLDEVAAAKKTLEMK